MILQKKKLYFIYLYATLNGKRGRCGHDSVVVGYTTTYAISAYHHLCCELESRSGQVYNIM